MFFRNSESKITDCGPGVERKVLAYDKDMMICEISFEKGGEGKPHNHPHIQSSYIIEGSFLFTVGDETQVLNSGDSVFIPSDVSHGVKCLEKGKLLDVFSPMREEFV